jgi:four helix bundle protein
MAHKVEELPLYSTAKEFWVAINEILQQPRLCADRDLRKQIDEANDSIIANIAEGFEQSSDDAFARFLYYSKGSIAEVMKRLHEAQMKGHISEADVESRELLATPLSKMLGGFIKYLRRSGFKDRGRFRATQEADRS